MFNLKTILTTLISTTVVGSAVALPAKANEVDLVGSTDAEMILTQIDYGNSYDRQADDSWKNIIGIAGLAIGTGVVVRQVSKAYKPALANSLPKINNSSNATSLDRVSPKLRRELFRLVHNQQTAQRLIKGTSKSHPGRSANWVAEKVIYDLKRDR